MKDKGWEVELDASLSSLNKKVRNAQLKQFNYILVAGDEEVKYQTINIRQRDGTRIGNQTLSDFENLLISQYPEGVALPERLFN